MTDIAYCEILRSCYPNWEQTRITTYCSRTGPATLSSASMIVSEGLLHWQIGWATDRDLTLLPDHTPMDFCLCKYVKEAVYVTITKRHVTVATVQYQTKLTEWWWWWWWWCRKCVGTDGITDWCMKCQSWTLRTHTYGLWRSTKFSIFFTYFGAEFYVVC
jgi:hypothetical protein